MQTRTVPESDPRPSAARARFAKGLRELQEGTLRCKTHGGVAAFSVCRRCGLGSCRECTVVLGGRSYCKSDAQMQLKRLRVSGESSREKRLTVTSFLSYSGGAVATGLGLLFIILGLIAPSMESSSAQYMVVAPNFAFFSSVFAFPPTTILIAGAALFGLGIADIIAGAIIPRSARMGSYAALVLAGALAIVGLEYLAVFAVVGVLVYAMVGIAIASVGTVVVGWTDLR